MADLLRRNENGMSVNDNDENTEVEVVNNSSLPSMLQQKSQLMSGVRKGDFYYIAIHGKSFMDIKKSFKIPIDEMEKHYNENSEDDINAVIAFALEALVSQMGGM